MIYSIVEGEPEDTLWPNGLAIVDSFESYEAARAGAGLLSSQNSKSYRIGVFLEIAVHRAPAMRLCALVESPEETSRLLDAVQDLERKIP